jgi:5-methylcytosine-specific restriction endonuclease McrA
MSDPDLDRLADDIVSAAGSLAAATCRWLLLVADFDARNGCARFNLPTTSHWLAYACSLSQRTACDHVRVARTLSAHPRLAEEMTAGRLSYSHLRAISRVVRAEESELVEELVSVARHGTVRHLELMVRGLRSVRDVEDGTITPPEEYVKHGWGTTNHWRITARLDPERGALVRSAIETVARAENLTQTDALVRLAEIGLAALADSDHPPRTLRGEEHAAVVVHLDARDRTAARPRIADGPALPEPVVERLLCGGRARAVLHDADGSPLDVGRSRRLVTRKLFYALLLRDAHCTHPGCRSRTGLEAHHVRHWLHGGRTDLDNLVLLCRRHHHAHHDGLFSMTTLGRQRFGYFRADGRDLTDYDPTPGATPIETEHPVSARAATSRWDGTRLQHRYAVSVLARALGVTERSREPRRLPDPDWDPWALPPTPGRAA